MIRTAVESDLDAVLALWRAADTVVTTTDDIDALRTLLASDPGALLLAVVDDELVGTLIAGWNGWRGSFWRLAVRPDFRRRGIARELVRAGEHRLHALGARRLDAILVDEEEGAAAFWTQLGYAGQHDRTRFVKNLA